MHTQPVRTTRRRRTTMVCLLAIGLVTLALATVSCGGTPPREQTTLPPTSTTLAPGVGDWTTYHHDMARSGVATDDGAPPEGGSLAQVHEAWTTPELDGTYIYAQPLVVGDRVLVATEGNSVYSLDAASGAIDWQVNLGAPVDGGTLACGNIDPSGITGTPVIDVDSGTMYVVAFLGAGPHHRLFALDLETGAVKWERPVDWPGLSAKVEQQRGALALAAGMVYVPFGGMSGDCGQYKGAVVGLPVSGTGEAISYVVPTSRMGGIWNPTGVLVDGAGDLWVATGNSAATKNFDYGNSVIRLSSALQVLDYFAPTDWAAMNKRDADLNTTAPVLLDGGRVFIAGKSGTAYLLDSGALGQVSTGLATVKVGSAAFGTSVALGSRVFVPTVEALVAVDVAGEQMNVAWSVPGRVSSPIVASGKVWALGNGGLLRAVEPSDGSVVFSLQIAKPPSQFITLSAANGRLFVADGTKILALSLR